MDKYSAPKQYGYSYSVEMTFLSCIKGLLLDITDAIVMQPVAPIMVTLFELLLTEVVVSF